MQPVVIRAGFQSMNLLLNLEILLTITYTLLFIYILGRVPFFTIPGISANFIRAGFLVKIVAGICVGLVYTYYYTDRSTADTFKFFDDSAILFNSIHEHPGYFIRMLTGIGASAAELQPYYDRMTNWYDIFSPFNDNRTMIRFNAMIRFVSFGHYYVHVVFICFLSFTGIVSMVKVFRAEYPQLTQEFYAVLVLLPSVLFWGSGLLKDALVFFSLGWTLYSFSRITSASSPGLGKILWFLLSFWFLMITKFQVFLLMIPLLLAWWIASRKHITPLPLFLGIILIAALVLMLPVDWIHGHSLPEIMAKKQQAFFQLATDANAGSVISIPELEPGAISMLKNAPVGFLIALVRPFITDNHPFLTLISGIENTLILLFGLFCLVNIKPSGLREKILPWFCLVYVTASFALIGMVTPVLGAMVRYKAQALPFLVIMFVIISSTGEGSVIRKYYVKLRNR